MDLFFNARNVHENEYLKSDLFARDVADWNCGDHDDVEPGQQYHIRYADCGGRIEADECETENVYTLAEVIALGIEIEISAASTR